MSDDAPSWAVPLIQSLGRVEGKLDTLSSGFAQHLLDDKVAAGKVELIEKQMVAAAAATGAKAKIIAAFTHLASSAFGAAATIFVKKHGI